LGEEEGRDKTFSALAQKPNDIIIETENMELVMNKMNKEDVWILPVVNKDDQYLGFISKSSVFNKYRGLLIRQGQYLE
jgi:CIC family chloride channel protein